MNFPVQLSTPASIPALTAESQAPANTDTPVRDAPSHAPVSLSDDFSKPDVLEQARQILKMLFHSLRKSHDTDRKIRQDEGIALDAAAAKEVEEGRKAARMQCIAGIVGGAVTALAGGLGLAFTIKAASPIKALGSVCKSSGSGLFSKLKSLNSFRPKNGFSLGKTPLHGGNRLKGISKPCSESEIVKIHPLETSTIPKSVARGESANIKLRSHTGTESHPSLKSAAKAPAKDPTKTSAKTAAKASTKSSAKSPAAVTDPNATAQRYNALAMSVNNLGSATGELANNGIKLKATDLERDRGHTHNVYEFRQREREVTSEDVQAREADMRSAVEAGRDLRRNIA